QIMPRAQTRLLVLPAQASVVQAASLMRPRNADLVIVCEGGAALGVVTKRDLVGLIARNESDLERAVSAIMTRSIVSCRPPDRLADVLALMRARGIHRVPVLEGTNPVGVVYERDALQALLCDAEHEDAVLRAYVQGLGYR